MDLGDTLRFSSDLTDGSGVLVNAQSVALTITLPDGTTASPTVANPPAITGKYLYDYVTTLASPQGRYTGQWLFTFAGGATTSYVEAFDVVASLVTVDEAVAHLRAQGILTTESDLEQLQWLCLVATDAIERDLGRDYTRKTIIERHNGGGRSVCLRRSPVLSITSVAEGGSTVTDYIADDFGIIWRNAWGWFARGLQNVTVTYVVGSLNPPPVVRKVALNAIQGMWQTSQQAPHTFIDDYAQDASVGVATGALTPLERSAYQSLRAAGIA